MPQRKKILEDIEALNTIKNLAESYEEVAVVKMQQIKDSVIRTRNFLADLSDIFVDLKASYNREINDLMARIKKGDKTVMPLLQKKGALIVYLSSNGKLYGSVTQKTFRLFAQDMKKDESKGADLAIIGSAGKEMFDNANFGRKYEYFEIPDVSVNVGHIKTLMHKFLQYEKVLVYFGKFNNVVRQNPIGTSITGEDIFETEVISPTPRDDRFIFEPTLEKIFHFFATQIMANLFSQTLLENQLARHASRVNAMEEALIHIEDEAKRLNRIDRQIKHQIQNKKQLETISGIVLWEE